MVESVRGQEALRLSPNGNGGRIPIHFRIGTKLIVGFLIIASITGTVGYLSLNYSQTVGEKFHLLEQQSLPTIDSLKEMKVAALNVEADTNELAFTPGVDRDKVLQDLTEQKNKFNENLNIYEDFVNKYFPDETKLNESIRNTANAFFQTTDKLVDLRQASTSASTLPPTLAQETLVNDKETAENALFKAIDTAISNEVQEVQNRSKAVDAAINSSSLVTLSSIIVSVIVAVVFGLFFSRYISIPISNLKQASIQIGKGDYRTACKFLSKTHRGDEIGKLSSEIEKMRQSIESMKTNLDKLVEQRTKELEIKNQELFEREKDLEKANQELVRTELAKEEFMSMVSHELKTPLTPLKMYAEMFLKTNVLGKLDEKQRQVMKLMRNNVSKLEMLVNDVMDVYKLDIGKLRLNKKQTQVSELVKENMAELQPLMEDKAIKFEAVIAPLASKIAVVCDSKRVGQVISNLVKNSVDFVPDKGGKITIKVEKGNPDDNVSFTVEDNGTGIPAEKADNLFKSFYQIDTTITRKHGGTGLGLAICKGIIEGHGGNIWIDKNYTVGTSIRFSLPIGGTNSKDQDKESGKSK
jgi:signal transduction histidine kinase